MCVKEFFGYLCGHCSVPTIRRCPISTSQEQFGPCQIPAERAISAGGYCHPCMRVVWNSEVLKNENKHKQSHIDGLCACSTVFKDATEKIERAQAAREMGGQTIQGTAYATTIGNLTPISVGEEASSNPRASWDPEAQKFAQDYTRYAAADHHVQFVGTSDIGTEQQSMLQTQNEIDHKKCVGSNRYAHYDAQGVHHMTPLASLFHQPYPVQGISYIEKPWVMANDYHNYNPLLDSGYATPQWVAGSGTVSAIVSGSPTVHKVRDQAISHQNQLQVEDSMKWNAEAQGFPDSAIASEVVMSHQNVLGQPQYFATAASYTARQTGLNSGSAYNTAMPTGPRRHGHYRHRPNPRSSGQKAPEDKYTVAMKHDIEKTSNSTSFQPPVVSSDTAYDRTVISET